MEGLTRDKTRARQTTAADRHRAESGRPGARAAAGRSNPLDRPDAGEGRGGEPALGATYPRGPPTRAASHPHVQAVERPEVNTDPRPSVQIRTSYSSHRKWMNGRCPQRSVAVSGSSGGRYNNAGRGLPNVASCRSSVRRRSHGWRRRFTTSPSRIREGAWYSGGWRTSSTHRCSQ